MVVSREVPGSKGLWEETEA